MQVLTPSVLPLRPPVKMGHRSVRRCSGVPKFKMICDLRASKHLFPSGAAHTAVCRQTVAPLEPLHGGSGGRTVLAVIFQPLAQRIELLLYQTHRAAGRAGVQHDAGVGTFNPCFAV